MDELIQRFRAELRNKDYEELDGTWLELVGSKVGLAELLAREADIAKVLVICPASLKSQWRNEIQRFSLRDCQLVLGNAALTCPENGSKLRRLRECRRPAPWCDSDTELDSGKRRPIRQLHIDRHIDRPARNRVAGGHCAD